MLSNGNPKPAARGPYAPGRIIDVSMKTAQVLGFGANGVARVRVEYMGPAPLDGSDDRLLLPAR